MTILSGLPEFSKALKGIDSQNNLLRCASQGHNDGTIDNELLKTFQGLKNILLAYSNHDQSINLLDKGMGQLIAAIVHHCKGDEVSTFWILVSLIENYDMRKFFQPGLPGIALYGECLSKLIERHLPELSSIFK